MEKIFPFSKSFGPRQRCQAPKQKKILPLYKCLRHQMRIVGKNIDDLNKCCLRATVPGTKKAKMLAPYNSAWHRKGKMAGGCEKFCAVDESFFRFWAI
ncbi:MAG: hypothetical protein LOD92_08950 [Bacillales bacterium]